MADYYPLISKAVAGLNPDAPSESRRALYERAQAALLVQLRTTNPPFTEAEIMHERLALEDAVRRVEEEAAQRAREARAPTLSDLVAAAYDTGNPATRPKRRQYVLHPNALANLRRSHEMSIDMPSMIVTGGGTGRLIRFWRWRSPPSRQQSAASGP
jgi:hypothetical protein